MFALRSIGNTKQDGCTTGLPFKMQNDTKQKQTNVKSVSVSVHSMLIYVKNKGNDSIFFQKDLEGIEYMRTFANVIKRVTPQE